MFMRAPRHWVIISQDFFLSGVVCMVGLITVAMHQSNLHYGLNDGYRAWRSFSFLSVSLMLFIALVPVVLPLVSRAIGLFLRFYLLSATAIKTRAVSFFYFISGWLIYALGFLVALADIRHARQYFDRCALFHNTIMMGLCLHDRISHQKMLGKPAKRSVDCKPLIRSVENICGVVTDDHQRSRCLGIAPIDNSSALDQVAKVLEVVLMPMHRKYLILKQYILEKEPIRSDAYVLDGSGGQLTAGRSLRPFDSVPFLTKETTT